MKLIVKFFKLVLRLMCMFVSVITVSVTEALPGPACVSGGQHSGFCLGLPGSPEIRGKRRRRKVTLTVIFHVLETFALTHSD